MNEYITTAHGELAEAIKFLMEAAAGAGEQITGCVLVVQTERMDGDRGLVSTRYRFAPDVAEFDTDIADDATLLRSAAADAQRDVDDFEASIPGFEQECAAIPGQF